MQRKATASPRSLAEPHDGRLMRAWPAPAILVLAQTGDRLSRDEVIDGIQQYWATNYFATGWGVLSLLAVLSIVAGLALWRHHQRARDNRYVLFLEAARHVGVSLFDQWLLVRIARAVNLASPLTLLLSPGTLKVHSQTYLQSVKSHARRRQAEQRVDRIGRFMFGPGWDGVHAR